MQNHKSKLNIIEQVKSWDSEIAYLYYNRKQQMFHIFAFNEDRYGSFEWLYLIRDEYSCIIRFLEDEKENHKVFSMNCIEAEDFYNKWSQRKLGESLYERQKRADFREKIHNNGKLRINN